MLVFNNYFCKNRKSKLQFGDRVAVLNVFLYQTGGSMYYVEEDAHMNVDEDSQWLRRGELNQRTKYPDGNNSVPGAYPLIFCILLCGHSIMFFVEMLGQLKCVSYYSEGSGVFCNDEGTPSIMHGIDPVHEGGNYIERYFHY
jgi:hypothetical protein